MIPKFTQEGVLPPTGGSIVGLARSPWSATFADVVHVLGTSPQRLRILGGLAQLRRELRKMGLSGWQWLDGSFVEDKEPRDVDVVTFARASDAVDRARLQAMIAGGKKANFGCDHYFVDMESPGDRLLQSVTYWHSLFSHRRGDLLWKGFVQVRLVESNADQTRADLLIKNGIDRSDEEE